MANAIHVYKVKMAACKLLYTLFPASVAFLLGLSGRIPRRHSYCRFGLWGEQSNKNKGGCLEKCVCSLAYMQDDFHVHTSTEKDWGHLFHPKLLFYGERMHSTADYSMFASQLLPKQTDMYGVFGGASPWTCIRFSTSKHSWDNSEYCSSCLYNVRLRNGAIHNNIGQIYK